MVLLCLAITAIWLFASVGPARAASAVCQQAGEAAAAEHGVPEPLMRAIAMVETGRRVEGTVTAWPWSLNVEGAGQF
ncbi:MAG: hypothetical protein AAFR44_05130, partial [Pseudomonadota bacterium]